MPELRAVVITDSARGGPSHNLHQTFQDNTDVELAALSDPSGESERAQWLEESGTSKGYDAYSDMLVQEKPDIAIIAIHRYDEDRLQAFLTAVRSGVRGIVIEKPVASLPAHVDQMVAAAEASQTCVVVAHRGRENPLIREVKRQADSGVWGPLIQVKAHGKGDHRCGVVDALVLGTHELNAMQYFVGADPISCWGTILVDGHPAKRVDAAPDKAYLAGQMAGDRVFAEYTFPNGVIGSYESMPVGAGAHSSEWLGCDLYFQNAVVTTRCKPDAQVHVFPEGGIFPQQEIGIWEPLVPSNWSPPATDPAAIYWPAWKGRNSMLASNQAIGAELVRCLHNNTTPVFASSLSDAAVTVDMIIGPQRSHLEGRQLDLPLEARGNPWDE